MFNNTKLKRAEKRSSQQLAALATDESGQSKVPRRISTDHKICECFFECGEEGNTMRAAMTINLNERLNDCAKCLNDGKLLAKLSAGDIIAQEMKYHPQCLAGLYNRERAYKASQKSKGAIAVDPLPIAFSELVTYINEAKWM